MIQLFSAVGGQPKSKEGRDKTAAFELGSECLNDTDESEKGDENEDEDDLAKYIDKETGEKPSSFFEVLCRECSKIPYTPEEQQVSYFQDRFELSPRLR